MTATTRNTDFDPDAPYFVGSVKKVPVYVAVSGGVEEIRGQGEVTHPVDKKGCYLIAVRPQGSRMRVFPVLQDVPEDLCPDAQLEVTLESGDVANVKVLRQPYAA